MFALPERPKLRNLYKNCEICTSTKIARAPCRKRTGYQVPRAETIDALTTADHKVLSEDCESRINHRCAVVVQDLVTEWLQSYPYKTTSPQETEKSLRKFLEPTDEPKVICSYNSLEFGKACDWNHCTSTPHRSETSGIAERAARRIKERTSAVLLQSGLDEKWWAGSMECYCYLRNVQELLSDGKHLENGDLKNHSKGATIPFGSMTEYHPISVRNLPRIRIVCGRHLQRRRHGRGRGRAGKFRRVRNPSSESQWKEIHFSRKW